MQIRGKKIDSEGLECIHQLIQQYSGRSRTQLSRLVCEELGWVQPNGKPQDVACREILRRLEGLGLLQLPRPRHDGNNTRRIPGRWLQEEWDFPEPDLEGRLSRIQTIELDRVDSQTTSRHFRGMMEEYHYLGYRPMVGRSVKYRIRLDGRVVGGISWGSAAWKLGPRDRFIGWDGEQRVRRLQHLAGNHRFLILPRVRIKNLASAVLARAIQQVRKDWQALYGIELYLLESFVDPSRFKGSCYRAANWIYLGQSQGSSKSGNTYYFHGQVKDIYVYPIRKDFREVLCGR